MAELTKVALLIETARGYGRGLLRGISRYAQLHGPWAFYITPGDFAQAVPKMEQWGGTGIIARIETPRIARALLATGLPVVALDLSQAQSVVGGLCSDFSEVMSDSVQAAQIAADHLLERGFRHYAFVGLPHRVWSERRQQGFCERIAAAGYGTQVYPTPPRADRDWGREQSILAEWIKALPKPIGLMACNDDRGREVLEACRAGSIRVPDDVAVVGVDNDAVLCDLADPPLSSVNLNSERGGYEAAALLDGLMRGRVRKPSRILVEPLGVATRRSTDVIAMGDREVAAALRLIRDHANERIGVNDIVRLLSVSRRALEIRFRRAMGHSIRTEIQHARLRRAKDLLSETDLSIAEVAESSGFGSASYLAAVFSDSLDMTPAKYRTHVRCR
jgi:LacI family transcriptional regulator